MGSIICVRRKDRDKISPRSRPVISINTRRKKKKSRRQDVRDCYNGVGTNYGVLSTIVSYGRCLHNHHCHRTVEAWGPSSTSCGLCCFIRSGQHVLWDNIWTDVTITDKKGELWKELSEELNGKPIQLLKEEKLHLKTNLDDKIVIKNRKWTMYQKKVEKRDKMDETNVANPPADSQTSNAEETAESETGQKLAQGTIVVRRTNPRPGQLHRTLAQDCESMEEKVEVLPPVGTLEACDKAAARLRELADHLHHGDVPIDVLQKTLLYAACVLDSVSIDEARRLLDEDDELSEVQPDAVPNEVREWLASTFTRQTAAQRRRADEKPRFRSVANAIRAGIMVDRIYRRISSSTFLQIPSQVAVLLKAADDWSFDVFTVNDVANGQALRYISHDLLNRYGLIHKFKIPSNILENFLVQIETGYGRHKNPYHNNIHAADVTQTVHYMLCQAGLANWLNDLEVFATLIAAIIHDFEHTGTTNNFHVMSGSDTALLYNDRAVLENYHTSAAFKLLKEEDYNILVNLSREEYREFRALVIEMVLGTDMSSHFQQIKSMKSLLTHSEFNIDKAKALSLVLHCSDISHPSKKWDLHFRWTQLLMEEFFQQGDKEKSLGLPYSPLCDRNTTLVAESQIGFIDFIVAPSMEVCGGMLEKIQNYLHRPPTLQETEEADVKSSRHRTAMQSPSKSADSVSLSEPIIPTPRSSPIAGRREQLIGKRPWLSCLEQNRINWQERADKDAEMRKCSTNGTQVDESE
ncbi:dual specificity calcium/calmodulin-dependent 3',5'-cyclic nucleotide phosphodiesterase 1A-like isoform X4 [Centruroides vittatus]|uniref:dual specificity calcium/calmodulin-dependent 3',5'-cyclic nucleotide phosphodiesterase 1A-like isoform X4 n=1 Tax=Centruroides vittatus TaxID=120091 RepID=UPI0035106D89